MAVYQKGILLNRSYTRIYARHKNFWAVNNLVGMLDVDEDQLPWPQVIGLRNRIAHEYFNIDFGIIWKTAERVFSF